MTPLLNFKRKRMKKNLLILFSFLWALMTFADNNGINVCSYVSYSSENWTYPTDLGIYSFKDATRSTIAATEEFSNYEPTTYCSTGGVYIDGHYKYVQTTSGRYGVIASTHWVDFDIAAKTFQKKEITGNPSNIQANIAYTEDYDPVTGYIYGYYQSSDYSSCYFGKRNAETGEVTPITQKSIGERLIAIAVDGSGQLWGIDYNGSLVKIDKANGNTTQIASVNLMGAPSGLCFDKKTGKLYMLMAQQLFEVDKENGSLSTLWGLQGSYSLQGLFIAAAAAEDKAPAAVSNMSVDFGSTGSLSGTVKFTAPSTTYDGKDKLNGEVRIKVVFNNETDELNIPAGSEYTYTKTLDEAGQYNISVYAVNDIGESPKKYASLYIGEDTPKAVENLNVVKKDGKAVLSWNAPEKGEHDGGYLPNDKINYTIKRILTDGTISTIASNLKSTTFTDNKFSPSKLTGTYYEVTANNGERQGGSTQTGKIVIGPALTPAVTLIHPKANDLDIFTQICNDKNNTYWEFRDPSPDRTGIYFNGTNPNSNTDNWLISPPIHMEKGKVYRITWTACNQTTPAWYPELMEVRIGKDATAEALSDGTELMPATVMKQDKEEGFVEKNFIPEETADYNIGFHDMTPQNDGYGILMWDFSVGEGLTAGVPNAPMLMSATAHDKGELQADFVFMAPSTTNTDGELTGDHALTAVKILDSSNKEVYRLNDVAAGGIVQAMGIPAKQGTNEFSIVAENAFGVGIPVKATVFAGVGLPNMSSAPVFSVENGLAVLRWKKCDDVSSDGKYVNPDDISYTVMVPTSEKDWKTLTVTKSTEYIVPKKVLDMEDGDQGLLYFGIRPSNAAGKGAMKETNYMLAGKTYKAPWKESCAEGIPSSYWMVDEFSQFNLTNWETSSFCSDDDGGSFVFKPSISSDQAADSCTVFFGKVDIKSLKKPALRFDTYITPQSKAWIDVKIATDCNISKRIKLETIDFSKLTTGGWTTETVDLSEYLSSDNVMLAFAGHSPNVPLYIDNIRIVEYADKDIVVTNVTAPIKLYSGNDGNVKVVVSNEGKDKVNSFNVNLYNDDKLIATQQGSELNPDNKQTFDFTIHADNYCKDVLNLKAEAVLEGDEVDYNNTFDGVNIRIKKPQLEAPTELNGIINDEKVSLSWNAPVIDKESPVNIIDSFEDLQSWSIRDFGEWTMIDGDGCPTYSLNGYNWTNAGKPHAAIVFAPAEIGIESYMPAADGEKYLASFAGEEECDDWIISPKLSGNEQKFSFMVSELGRDQSVSDEKFELLVSKTTPDANAFEKVGDTHVLDFAEPQWNEVELDVEEGVKYVAIHHITSQGTALLIDNAKYQMAPLPFNYELTGYNVYCDGKLLNDEPLKDTRFTTEIVSKTSVYTVKAVYSVGISDDSNSFDISVLGIDCTTGEMKHTDNNIYDIEGRKIKDIKRNGIYIIDGKKAAIR